MHKTVSKVLHNLPIPASSTATTTFCLIMDKLFDICHECQQHNSELKPLEAPFLSTDDPRFLWLKYQILMFFEDRLKTIEVRSEVYEKSEKQKIFTFYQKSIKSIKIKVHTVMGNRHIKFSTMHNVSYVLAKRFSQDPLDTYI